MYHDIKISLEENPSAFIAKILQEEDGICSIATEHIPLPPVGMRIFLGADIEDIYPELEGDD